MLVLSRRLNESIQIKLDDGSMIDIVLIAIAGDKARIGISAPKHIPVHRSETWDKINQQDAENN